MDFDFSTLGKKKHIGSLGFVEEAAGKVRVFAMVDCWTQWLLDPLMSLQSSLLEKIPQDGTKSQLSPLNRLLKRYPKGPFYCYDLKSATDRLPISLQVIILKYLIGDTLADL